MSDERKEPEFGLDVGVSPRFLTTILLLCAAGIAIAWLGPLSIGPILLVTGLVCILLWVRWTRKGDLDEEV